MTTMHETSKDRVLRIVQDLPADVAYDDILHELALARMIDRGLEDSRAGRTVSNADAKRRIDSWSA
jgi:predicted transcriptional regulator